MNDLSLLRLLGVVLALVGVIFILVRRRHRLLGRLELVALVLLIGVGLVGAFPSAADVLPRLTGFTGELRRITSLLAFAVLGLTLVVAVLQTQVAELRYRFSDYLRRSAVARAFERTPPETKAELAIVMPAFNEADNLPYVLERAPRAVCGLALTLIVVDDGSDDGTADVARALGAFVVENPVNAGGGHALHTGFSAARRLGASIVVTMDADGQHRFDDLETLCEPIVRGDADVVIGSRRLGTSVGHEAFRALGLRIFNLIISFLVGRRITDCSSGYRAFRMARFGELRLIQQRHHTAEMIIEAVRRGLKVEEVPITIVPRRFGESKKGTNWLYGVRFANTILSTWWRRK